MLARRSVRSLALAFTGFGLSEYGVWVSVLVYAYERGGATVTAAVALGQLVPAGLLAPVLARSVDRRGAVAALTRGYWFQCGALAATSSLMLCDGPQLLVYAAAVLAAVAVTATRPAQAALLDTLVDTSDQLTVLTVLSGWIESVSLLIGPAIAGLLIGLQGPGAAILAFALCTGGAALLAPGAATRGACHASISETDPAAADDSAIQSTGQPGRVALLTLLGAEYVVIGMLDVLLVVLAISVLGLGASGAGYLNAAYGAGGAVGSIAAVSLIGPGRLASPLIAAAIGLALLLAVLGAWLTVLGAFVLLAGVGSARSLLDVSGRTLLLRITPPSTRGRAFGLLEGIAMLGLAFGSALVPLLIAIDGASATLLSTGALLMAITLAAAAHVNRIEGREQSPRDIHHVQSPTW